MNREVKGTLYSLIAGILWGTTGTFVRYFTRIDLSSIQISAFKIMIPGIILLIICLIKDKNLLKIKKKDILFFFLFGTISLDFFTIMYFTTIQNTSMAVAAVLLYLAPPMVMIMSSILFKEKITLAKIIACVMAFMGCVFVAGLVGSGEKISNLALVSGILAAFGYALYSIFGEFAIKKGYSSLTISTYSFIFADFGLLFLIRPNEIIEATTKAPLFEIIFMFIITAVTVSLLPYIFYTSSLSLISPSKASIIASVEPITATVIGFIFFNESLDIYGVIGIILVLSAIVILNINFKKKS